MEMHQLRYVVALARVRNFSRAAEQCNVAQPSLSQQILKLEAELGERLFERRMRHVRLTAHGTAFLQRAVRILEEVDAAKREAGDALDLKRGAVAIGVLPTIAPYALPPIMARFSRQFPGVDITVHEDTTARLLKLVHDYEIDFAVVSDPINDSRLAVTELFTEELVLALPPKHPLGKKRAITAADIQHEKLIVLKAGHCLGDQVLDFCERQQMKPHIGFRSAQLETVQELVCSGLGLSLVPAMAKRTGTRRAPDYRSLQSPRPQRKIMLVWPKLRPPGRAAAELVKLFTGQPKAN
ncbi:MAG: LysR family transcriptional regulator [Opitutaceae bacterium]|nr:LysR family transcriptional regulator [Opitutaceae bacterium]